jgi:hypothetical protein
MSTRKEVNERGSSFDVGEFKVLKYTEKRVKTNKEKRIQFGTARKKESK